jgi:anti-anti-sigma factor
MEMAGDEMVLSWSSAKTENGVGSVRVVDSVAIVRLRGEVDLTTSCDLRELLSTARATRASTVLVDMRGVSFIDASSVGVIISARVAARRSGQQLWVDGLVKQPARVFDILGLRGLFGSAARVPAARAGPGWRGTRARTQFR